MCSRRHLHHHLSASCSTSPAMLHMQRSACMQTGSALTYMTPQETHSNMRLSSECTESACTSSGSDASMGANSFTPSFAHDRSVCIGRYVGWQPRHSTGLAEQPCVSCVTSTLPYRRVAVCIRQLPLVHGTANPAPPRCYHYADVIIKMVCIYKSFTTICNNAWW